ncbi:MAG: beta-ketoacyl synthase N-terminal-like domain-containing protein [Candidatus Omnitrophota bacterium]|jgi:3-oxoacyl-(acyl-carrier-protein) synthase
MENRKRIVITGIGPLSSVGVGKDNFWQGILEKRINLRLEKYFIDDELWGEFYLHKIDKFSISEFGIDRDKLNDIKEWKEGEEITDLNYLIAAVKLALDDSKLDYHSEKNDISLVLAHENLGLMPFGLKTSHLAYDMLIDKQKKDITKKDFFDKFYRNFLKSGYDVQTFADLFHVARVFNIHNYSLFLNNACASGLYALEAASQIIKQEQAKAVVVAAADCPDIYKYLWFRDLKIYSKDGKIRPFSKDSNGLVFGDGGVGIVIEDLLSAQSRKATIYAEYMGGGFNLEGWKITVPQIGSNSYQNAIKAAFKHSNIAKEKIDFICPHGVGSQPVDYYEAKAITDFFGLNPTRPLITTFKPYFGHNLGGSALLETAALLLSLKNNIIPPTLNCENLDPKFNILLVKDRKEIELNMAMKICCAFAGYNAAVLFKRFSY